MWPCAGRTPGAWALASSPGDAWEIARGDDVSVLAYDYPIVGLLWSLLLLVLYLSPVWLVLWLIIRNVRRRRRAVDHE